MARPKQISIWYFIGVLLVIYGALILGAGLYEFVSPPDRVVVLANLHAGVWWGALMLIMGSVYVYLFRPGRRLK
jgi:hypothetical protein